MPYKVIKISLIYILYRYKLNITRILYNRLLNVLAKL